MYWLIMSYPVVGDVAKLDIQDMTITCKTLYILGLECTRCLLSNYVAQTLETKNKLNYCNI